MYTFSPTSGERFYNLIDADAWLGGGKEIITEAQVPSVTTILGIWPKSEEFHRWIASKEDYGQAIAERNAGARRGTRVHNHIERIVKGEVLDYHRFRDEFHRGDDFAAYDEWRRLESFAAWHKDMGYPTIVQRRVSPRPALECTLYSWKYGFAGTTDIVVTGGIFGNARVMIDFKTGKSIYDSFWAQLSAYRRAWMEMGECDIDAVGVLLFGGLGRKHYAFEICSDPEEIERWFQDFLASQRIWKRCNQKTGIRGGERWWGEVKSQRDTYEVIEELRLDKPMIDRDVAAHIVEDAPAWAKRPAPERVKLEPAIGKEQPSPPAERKQARIIVP